MNKILNSHVFLISDLHLGDPASGVDQFHSDEVLCDFVSAYIPQRAGGERATLVIHGDFLDFPRIPPCFKELEHPTVGATEAESVAKVGRAIEGHRKVFDGLSTLLGRGDQLLLLAGNHDVDLYWPGVRAGLCHALSCEERELGFVPEGVLRDRGLHVQHGHQLSAENRFRQWPPRPSRAFDGKDRLERCWGTFFMEGVYNLAEAFAPWIGLVHPTWRAIFLAIKHSGWDTIPPPVAAAFLAFFARFGKRIIIEQVLSDDDEPAPRTLAEVANELGLQGGKRSEAMARAQALLDQDRSYRRDPDDEAGAGGTTLRQTVERGITRVTREELADPEILTVVMGHTHRALTTTGAANKVMINTGSWTGHLPVDDWRTVTFEDLLARAAQPEHRRTFAYVAPGAAGTLETYG